MPKTSFIEGLGQGAATQAATGIIGAGLGLALEKHNDRRQIKQQQKLTDMQVEANRNLAQFSQDLQFDMWNKTNYGAQMEHLKKAGLNPALIYGGTGAGGTTGSASAGTASGGHSPSGGGEIIAQQGMGLQSAMQMQLMKAQKENIEADTANKLGDAANKPIVGQQLQAGIAQIAAGIKNTEAQTELLQIDKELKNIDVEIKGRTIEDQIDIITGTASSAMTDAIRLQRRNQIEQVTLEDTIKQIKAEAIGAVLENIQTKAETRLTNAQTETEGEKRFLTREQSRKIGQEIFNMWDGNEINRTELQLKIKEALGTDDISKDVLDGIQTILLLRAGGKGLGQTTNKIGFKTGK